MSLEDHDVRMALAEGWAVDSAEMRYVPLGGGSYHWDVDASDGARWFVSATDLDHAPWLGADRPSSWRTLTATMRAAVTLLTERRLAFVAAPTPSREGEPARLVEQRFGLVVHPFLQGECGTFGARLHVDTNEVVSMIAALHATPPAASGLHQLVDVNVRAALDPSEPRFRPIVERYEELLHRFGTRPPVITHGEPHAGNVIRSGGDTYLIDWDTAALALPERDLWLLLDHGHADVVRLYEDQTGYVVDPEALSLYQLRWKVEELIGAVRDLDEAAIERTLADASAAAAR